MLQDIAFVFRKALLGNLQPAEIDVGNHDSGLLETNIQRRQVAQAPDKKQRAINSTTDSATCETTRMRRRLKRSRPPDIPRLPDCSKVAGSARVARTAGASPKETVVSTASAAVKASKRQSIPRSRKI